MAQREDPSSARYYASPQEQKILINGLQRYFSLPERSQNRNKIAKEVSQFLSMYSPHWSHRAVRLWFNNNKHTYMPMINQFQNQVNQKDMQLQIFKTMAPSSNNQPVSASNDVKTVPVMTFQPNRAQVPMQQAPQQVTQQQQVVANDYSSNNINTGSFVTNPPLVFNSNFSEADNGNNSINNNSVISNITGNLQVSKPFTTAPEKSQNIIKFSPIVIPGAKNSSNQSTPNSNANSNANSSASNTPGKIQTDPSYQNWNNNEQTEEQSYTSIAATLNGIQRIDNNDPSIQRLIENYDKSCMQHIAKYGNIIPERIEPMIKYKFIRFKFPQEPSMSMINDPSFSIDLSLSNSSSFGHIFSKSFGIPTGMSTEFNNGFPSGYSIESFQKDSLFDQPSENNIFQSRPFTDEKLTNFDAFCLTNTYELYASINFGATQRMLYIKNYREGPDPSVRHYTIESKSPIDSISMNSVDNSAWLLSKSNLIRIPLSNTGSSILNSTQITIDLSKIDMNNTLEFVTDGVLSVYGNGTVVGFPSVPNRLFFARVKENNEPDIIMCNSKNRYDGYRAFCCLDSSSNINDQKLLCAISKSTAIRLIDPNHECSEIRSFVGHCGQVLGIEKLSENLFVSRSDDETVRIWDIREKSQISTITTPNISAISLTGCDDYVICGFHNRYICAVDLRKDYGKPVLGVSTDDYSAIALSYMKSDDSLAMLGMVDKDTVKDSMMFVDANRQNKQRIFRFYSNFIGFESGNQ